MTNTEWRRICSNEDFAKFICHLLKGDDLYLGIMSLKSLIQNAEKEGKDGVAEVQAWLQEEHDMNNENWFCGLSTEEKADFFCTVQHCLTIYGDHIATKEDWEKWLKRRTQDV